MFEIISALFIDLKCSYILALWQGILLILKLTCKRKLSLLIALIAAAANLEALALIALLCQITFG